MLTFKHVKMKGQAFVGFINDTEAKKCLDLLSKKLTQDEEYQFVELRPILKMASSDSDTVLLKKLNEEEFAQYLQSRKDAKQKREEQRQKLLEASKEKTSSHKRGPDHHGEPTKKKQRTNVEPMVPHNVLLVLDLPSEVEKTELDTLFGKFPGFVETRLVAARHVCFVEYETVQNALQALKLVGGLIKVAGGEGRVIYAKK